MGPDDPTVRGRRISAAAMKQARRDFERSYRESIQFALELVDKVRAAVAKAIDQHGPSEDGEYEEEVGMKAWQKLMSQSSVRAQLVEQAKECCVVDAPSFQP